MSCVVTVRLLPELVAAVYGNGSCEARIRGTDWVVRRAQDLNALVRELQQTYPNGFKLDVKYDPHM